MTRVHKIIIGVLALGSLASQSFASEGIQQSGVARVSLTQYGVAAVTESAPVGGKDKVRVMILGKPLEGSLYFSGIPVASARSTYGRIASEQPPAIVHDLGDLQASLKGESVTLYFKSSGATPLKGKLIDWNIAAQAEGSDSYLILQEAKNVRYIDPSTVGMLQFSAISTEKPFMRAQPALDIVFRETAPESAVLDFHYLVEGFQWQPTYSVEIVDERLLRVTHSASIVNGLGDFENAEVELLIGEPPLPEQARYSPEATRKLVNDRTLGRQSPLYSVWAGTHALREAEHLQVNIDTRELSYEPVVRWDIFANRKLDGTLAHREDEGDLWNALRFNNGFPYPFGAGQASVHEQSRFKAFTQMPATPMRGHVVLNIDRAEAIRVEVAEDESLSKPAKFNGKEATQLTIRGVLTLANYRNEPVTLLIERDLVGTILESDGAPRITGLWTAFSEPNARQHLSYEIALEPGEEQVLNYRYQVNVLK